MSDTPETQEAVERWQQGKINIFDEMARLERERDEAIQQFEVGQVINSGLASKLEQYQRNLELIAEDCEAWLNSENDEPSAEFIKLVAKYAREAIK